LEEDKLNNPATNGPTIEEAIKRTQVRAPGIKKRLFFISRNPVLLLF
jgi:hypothetical protein